MTAGAAWREFDNVEALGIADEENTWWGIRSGAPRTFNSLGKTAVYAEYQHTENDNFRGTPGQTSEAEIIGAGIVQNIDAAAMELYLGYRHVEVDDNVPADSFDSLDVVTAGARIKF